MPDTFEVTTARTEYECKHRETLLYVRVLRGQGALPGVMMCVCVSTTNREHKFKRKSGLFFPVLHLF